MNKFVKGILIVGIMVFFSGCYETKQTFFLNPDSSGKVILEAKYQPVNISFTGEETDPEAQMEDSVRDILEKSSGIDAWKNVDYKLTDDGKIWFKGIAYFPDVSNLKFHNLGTMNIEFTKGLDGTMVLEMKEQKEEKKKGIVQRKQKDMTEEEITKKIRSEKAKYQQMRPMLVAFLSTLKEESIFHLPGNLAEKVSNFKKMNEKTISFTFEGKKLIEVIDGMMQDDNWWRSQVTAGIDFAKDGPSMDMKMNQKLFGEKAPIRAVVGRKLTPLFNYSVEVAEAIKSSPKLFAKHGIATTIPTVSSRIENFKSLKIGGVRLVRFSDSERDVRPLNYDKGYTLSIVGELPCPVLNVTEGKLETAIADNGENLLPEREWDSKIHFPRLSKDKTIVIFDVNLSLPGENVRGIREVSGILKYNVASGSRKVDLGITDFTIGSKGKEFGAVIKSINRNKLEKGKQTLSLKLNLSQFSIKSVTFYDDEKNKLDVSSHGYFSMGGSTTFEYSCKGTLPETGSIVVEIFEKLEKYEIPFKLTNISLTGQPLKSSVIAKESA